MDSNTTIAWLATNCRQAAVDEKWLLVEHLRVGQQWKDRLTRSGCWHINLHAKTFPLMVSELSAAWLATNSLLPIGRSELQLMFDRVVQDLQQAGQLAYFRMNDSGHHGLARLLVRTYNDWRLAGLAYTHIDAEAFEVPAKAQDLSLIFSTVRERLSAANQADYADRVEGVIDALRAARLTLPPRLRLLQPEAFPLTRREQELLDVLRECGSELQMPESTPWPASEQPIQFTGQVAVGEVNEVRGMFQQCMAEGEKPIPLDQVEVLATDYPRYAPLVLESLWQWLASEESTSASSSPSSNASSQYGVEQLPVTFAEGIPCIYSRPGRLLRSWIRWSESDYLQAKAVQIVREGLLARPTVAAEVGYARLASMLRRVPIGFGLERYLPQIHRELEAAEREARQSVEDDPDFRGDCGAAALRALLLTIDPLVTLAPKPTDTSAELLESARQLLKAHARAESVVDRYARAKLLDEIDSMLSVLRTQSDDLTNVRAWLEELPTRSRLFSSTPRPGAVHVAPLEQGGAAGRARVFLLGMDDRKFPRRQAVDPILLDSERTRISPNLITSAQITSHQQAAVERVCQRMQGVADARIVISYSLIDLVDDSECFASPLPGFIAVLPQPTATVSFIAQRREEALTATELFHRQLLLEPDEPVRWQLVEHRFPRVARQRLALAQQFDQLFSAHDGWVPQAGQDLLTGAISQPMSPSRLEMLGTCPRKYFFSRALSISPPSQGEIDNDRWLTALDVGSLLHDLFEEFLRELQQADQTPDPTHHSERLAELLKAKIAKTVERVPVHNPEAFHRQCDELLETCEIFLHKEQEYAARRHAKTWLMEASLGSLAHSQPHAATEIDTDQPIIVPLDSGRQLHLCGRIDRIDRVARTGKPPKDNSNDFDYLIWDYKTGSDWGFDHVDPIKQGRKLQPLLYTRMLAARLQQLGGNPQAVRSFGYFFPSPRTEGQRYEWTVEQLAHGNGVLESMLDLLAAGTFIATNDAKDCGICDYQRICGPADQLVEISNLKTNHPENQQLEAWRKLRSGGK